MKNIKKQIKNLTKSIANNRKEIIEKMRETTYNAWLIDYMDFHVVLDLNDDLEIKNIFLHETIGDDDLKYFTIYSLKGSEQIGDYLEKILKEYEEYETVEDLIYSKEYTNILDDILDGIINDIKKNP